MLSPLSYRGSNVIVFFDTKNGDQRIFVNFFISPVFKRHTENAILGVSVQNLVVGIIDRRSLTDQMNFHIVLFCLEPPPGIEPGSSAYKAAASPFML